jgi:hypothetical protein
MSRMCVFSFSLQYGPVNSSCYRAVKCGIRSKRCSRCCLTPSPAYRTATRAGGFHESFLETNNTSTKFAADSTGHNSMRATVGLWCEQRRVCACNEHRAKGRRRPRSHVVSMASPLPSPPGTRASRRAPRLSSLPHPARARTHSLRSSPFPLG